MASTEIRELRSRIGRAIRKLREEEGISAQYLAKVLGVTQPTISRIESGATSISAENLFFIAKSFNRPISFFVGEQSPTVHDIQDILRAGLVQYGATHLKSKRSIDAKQHWNTYADFLNEALNEVSDPRIAASVATTLYIQATNNELQITRILTTVRSERLIANLFALLSLIDQARFKIKQSSKIKDRALKKLGKLQSEILHDYKIDNRIITVAGISDQYVAAFINESLGYD